MKTHKHITDKNERDIVLSVLNYIRVFGMPYSADYEYLHFPISEEIYGTYNMKNRELEQVEYRLHKGRKKSKIITLV